MIMAVLNYLDDVLYYPILMVILIAAGLIFPGRRAVSSCACYRKVSASSWKNRRKPGKYRLSRLSWFRRHPVSVQAISSASRRQSAWAVPVPFSGCGFWPSSVGLRPSSKVRWPRFTSAAILGHSYGGPAYYIETAMHKRWLGVLFAFSLILTYAGGFNLLCSFNMQSTFLVYSFYDPTTTPWMRRCRLCGPRRLLSRRRRPAHHQGHVHPGPGHGRHLYPGSAHRHRLPHYQPASGLRHDLCRCL